MEAGMREKERERETVPVTLHCCLALNSAQSRLPLPCSASLPKATRTSVCQLGQYCHSPLNSQGKVISWGQELGWRSMALAEAVILAPVLPPHFTQ